MIRYERDAGGDLVASSIVRVGLGEIDLTVSLGPWDGPDPDPAGLAQRPVVVLAAHDDVELAAAGARRSGRTEPALLGGATDLAARLLRSKAEVAVVPGGTGSLLAAIRALGGRPIPALPLPDRAATERFLEGCAVDLDLVVPSVDDRRRNDARQAILALHLELVHHVVEVDPRPSFQELGLDMSAASLRSLTAAAAGVLAVRLGARNRSWRPQA